MTKLQTNIYHGGTEAVNKPSMTNFHKFSGEPKCIATSQRSFIGHLNDKFFVAKPSYSFDSGFIHSFTEGLIRSISVISGGVLSLSGEVFDFCFSNYRLPITNEPSCKRHF